MYVIYFSSLAWDEAGGVHNPTQMSRALARRGHSVLFVEPQPSASREQEDLPIEIVALTELGMTPTQLRRAWFGLDSGELDTVAENLSAHLAKEDLRAAVFSAPFDPYVRLVPILRAENFLIVYYAMDDFAAAPALGYTQFVPGAEEFLARESDLVIGVTAPAAASAARFGKRARVLPNGIAAEESRADQRPQPIQRGELTLGFWGTIMESLFDADLIAHVARARPRWTIHLLGAVDPEPHRPPLHAQLEKFSNVFLHGAVPHKDLAGYAAASDVMLAPFPNNAFTRGRDPIKVYEYLAAHKPVVASYAPQLENIPYVTVAYSPQDFANAIQHAASAIVDVTALDHFLAQQSWDARADMLLALLRDTAPATNGRDAKILPGFAHPDAAAVMRYARALEVELDQVQRWARELERIAQSRPNGFARLRQWMPTWSKRN